MPPVKETGEYKRFSCKTCGRFFKYETSFGKHKQTCGKPKMPLKAKDTRPSFNGTVLNYESMIKSEVDPSKSNFPDTLKYSKYTYF